MPTKSSSAPGADVFQQSFRALVRQMTDTRRRLLRAHLHFPNRQATMSQISRAMGWASFSTANWNYGRLSRLVGQQCGFQPDPKCHLLTLCTFIRPRERGDHWLIIMRPEVAEAVQKLAWA